MANEHKKLELVLEKVVELFKKADKKLISRLDSSELEKHTLVNIQKAAKDLKIPLVAELISGKAFPDIVCQINGVSLGVEVKSTKSDGWESFGNSINESTRELDLEHIYVFFGKLGGVPDFKFSNYEDVLDDVKITHYPRYMVNMNCSESVFKKMKTTYERFRSNDDKYKILKAYYRSRLKPGEELWWMEGDGSPAVIKLWSTLEDDLKSEIIADAFILFTELFHPSLKTKYDKVTGWLVSRHQVVSPSLRDNFSAGGQVTISGMKFPQVVNKLMENMDEMIGRLSKINRDDLAFYWNVDEKKNLPADTKILFATWETRITNNLSQDMDKERLNIFRKEVKKWLK